MLIMLNNKRGPWERNLKIRFHPHFRHLGSWHPLERRVA